MPEINVEVAVICAICQNWLTVSGQTGGMRQNLHVEPCAFCKRVEEHVDKEGSRKMSATNNTEARKRIRVSILELGFRTTVTRLMVDGLSEADATDVVRVEHEKILHASHVSPDGTIHNA